jgi:hypothetical protein
MRFCKLCEDAAYNSVLDCLGNAVSNSSSVVVHVFTAEDMFTMTLCSDGQACNISAVTIFSSFWKLDNLN